MARVTFDSGFFIISCFLFHLPTEWTGILRPLLHSFCLPPSFTYWGGTALSTRLFYIPDYNGIVLQWSSCKTICPTCLKGGWIHRYFKSFLFWPWLYTTMSICGNSGFLGYQVWLIPWCTSNHGRLWNRLQEIACHLGHLNMWAYWWEIKGGYLWSVTSASVVGWLIFRHHEGFGRLSGVS